MAASPFYDDPSVTAYALDELPPQEKTRVETMAAQSPQAQAAIDETRRAAKLVTKAYEDEPEAKAAAALPDFNQAEADDLLDAVLKEEAKVETKKRAPWGRIAAALILLLLLLGGGGWWWWRHLHSSPPLATTGTGDLPPGGAAVPKPTPPPLPDSAFNVHAPRPGGSGPGPSSDSSLVPADGGPGARPSAPAPAVSPEDAASASLEADAAARLQKYNQLAAKVASERSAEPTAPPPAPAAFPELVVSAKLDAPAKPDALASSNDGRFQFLPGPLQAVAAPTATGFALPEVIPASGTPPPTPPEGVAEEAPGVKMIDYGAEARAPLPVVLLTRVVPSPWSPDASLVFIALQPVAAGQAERPRASLVFLVNISTTMDAPDRLPMFKEAFTHFLDGLKPDDQVALVVYSGDSARWLPITPVREKETIRAAFDRLATAETGRPGASLQMAYDLAHQGFIPGGLNRVIAITDGDLDLGIGESGGLYDYVARQAHDGVTLSIIGLGHDFAPSDKVRQLIHNGKGLADAARSPGGVQIALDREVTPSAPAPVQNLKLELALMPERVQAFRLIGYQNQFPITGNGAAARPGAGLLAVYETKRPTGGDIPDPLDVNLRYHRPADGPGEEQVLSQPLGAPDRADPAIVQDFQQKVDDLTARLKALPVDTSSAPKSDPPPLPADPGAKPIDSQDYQDFRKNAEQWLQPPPPPALAPKGNPAN